MTMTATCLPAYPDASSSNRKRSKSSSPQQSPYLNPADLITGTNPNHPTNDLDAYPNESADFDHFNHNSIPDFSNMLDMSLHPMEDDKYDISEHLNMEMFPHNSLNTSTATSSTSNSTTASTRFSPYYTQRTSSASSSTSNSSTEHPQLIINSEKDALINEYISHESYDLSDLNGMDIDTLMMQDPLSTQIKLESLTLPSPSYGPSPNSVAAPTITHTSKPVVGIVKREPNTEASEALAKYQFGRKSLESESPELSTTPPPANSSEPSYFTGFDSRDWENTQSLKYQLQISEVPAKSRVETQIKVAISFFPIPTETMVHLPSDTISKPRLQLRVPFTPSPDTLMLDTIVVCDTNLDQYVNICNGCINRERKRAARKKVKNPIEELHWQAHQQRRAIILNCREVIDFSNIVETVSIEEKGDSTDVNGSTTLSSIDQDSSNHGVNSGLNSVNKESFIQGKELEIPMRLACYCRHHQEKIGFRAYFVFRDHTGQVVARGRTTPIMITDDHKTANINPTNTATTTTQANPTNPLISASPSTPVTALAKSLTSPCTNSSGIKRPMFEDNIFSNINSGGINSGGINSGGINSGGINTVTSPQMANYTHLHPNSRSNSHSHSQSLVNSRSGSSSSLHSLDNGNNNYEYATLAKKRKSSASSSATVTNATNSVLISPVSTTSASGTNLVGLNNNPNNLNNRSFLNMRNHSFNFSSPSPSSTGPTATHTSAALSPPNAVGFTLSDSLIPSRRQPKTAPSTTPFPVIQRIVPGSGTVRGGIEVTLLGSGFYNGLVAKFGDNISMATHCWNETTMVAHLPASAMPGPVIVSFASVAIADPQVFTYIDDTDRQLIELALQVVGLKMNGKLEDARDIARRIVGSNTGFGNELQQPPRHQQNQNGQGHSMSDQESLVLKCLQLVDFDFDFFYPGGQNTNTRGKVNNTNWQLRSNQGQTMLHLASALGYTHLVDELITRGSLIDSTDSNGMTALHFAALNGHQEVVVKLVRMAPSGVNKRNFAGHTPAEMTKDECIISTLGRMGSGGIKVVKRVLPSLLLDASSDEESTSEESGNDDYQESDSDSEDADSNRGNFFTNNFNRPTRILSHYLTNIKENAINNWENLAATTATATTAIARTRTGLIESPYQQLWNYFQKQDNNNNSDEEGSAPPSYDEIFPCGNNPEENDNEPRDVEQSSSGPVVDYSGAVLDTDKDLSDLKLPTTLPLSGVVATTSTSTLTSASSSSETTTVMSEDEVLQAWKDKRKQLQNDRMLFFFWLPVLIFLLVWMSFKAVSYVNAHQEMVDGVREWILRLTKQVVGITTGIVREGVRA
ncbi:hypothetical protein NADFUDRAFT_66024 [Nadsonia fulvescens var. elongata DSM 6958]|uniref:IPT/TIG domain-containing protein n=1 Tax=Nadsonia fulvescens var. elongata DSM 6958 TaxID=857566 RepID=A0A1E3PHJ9_9ASCO|nr:hypothetical protein NADFUDRAFT_66024 [Nadsonia fulvescens var. elongata DSM 6958]